MAPIDYIKRTSTPDGYSRGRFLPVDQLSLTAPASARSRAGGLLPVGMAAQPAARRGQLFQRQRCRGRGRRSRLSRPGTISAARSRPQGARQRPIWRFAAHRPSVISIWDFTPCASTPNIRCCRSDTAATPLPSGYAGTFKSVYPSGTDLYGFSFSTYVGDSNVAGEISGRRNMPLVSSSPISLTLLRPLGDNYGYARATRCTPRLSGVTTLGPTDFWDSADLSGEIAANNVLDVTRNPEAFNSNRTRFASSFRVLFQPHYFQVLPNLTSRRWSAWVTISAAGPPPTTPKRMTRATPSLAFRPPIFRSGRRT